MARTPFTVRMSDRERRLVDLGAEFTGRSRAGFVREAVRERAIEILRADEDRPQNRGEARVQ